MNELGSSSIFSKIDLQSGYWQIRMDPHDVYKSTFHAHEGHHEFLLMPFGLTNTPSTFKQLMNVVFQASLHKFVLVLFDDILIYSRSREEHLQHLMVVLEVLQQHQLFAKMKKCQLGCLQIEYLGNIINEASVQTNPSKIEAIQNWLTPQTVKQLLGFFGVHEIL